MKPALTLRHQILIFTFGIVVVLMGLSLSVIHDYMDRQVHREVVLDLEKTRATFVRFMQERAGWLHSQCSVVAEAPRFTAILDIDDPDLAEHVRTVLPIAKQFQRLISSDLFMVANQEGQSLARIEISRSPGADLQNKTTISRALAGENARGTWVLQGDTYYVVTVPVRQPGRLLGTLSVGFTQRLEIDVDPVFEYLNMEAAKKPIIQSLVDKDFAAIAALCEQLQRSFESDLVAVTDPAGQALDLRVSRASFGEDLSALPIVQDALEGRESKGLQIDQNRIYHMVVVPVWSQDQVIGTLSAGLAIDDQLARDLKAMTHSEVSFALSDTVVASTLPAPSRQQLELRVDSEDFAPSGQAIFEMELGEETYLSLADKFGTDADRDKVL